MAFRLGMAVVSNPHASKTATAQISQILPMYLVSTGKKSADRSMSLGPYGGKELLQKHLADKEWKLPESKRLCYKIKKGICGYAPGKKKQNALHERQTPYPSLVLKSTLLTGNPAENFWKLGLWS